MKKPLTRKEQRKQKRKEKKVKRNEFFTKKMTVKSDLVDEPSKKHKKSNTDTRKKLIQSTDQQQMIEPKQHNNVLSTEQLRRKEQKEQQRIQKEMDKRRAKQLLEANAEEDRIIRQMEKNLGLKKRKSKTLPKCFSEYGLDYLLEVCDPETMKTSIAAEKGLHEINDRFEEDFALMTGQDNKSQNGSVREDSESDGDVEEEEESETNSNQLEDDELDEQEDSIDEIDEDTDELNSNEADSESGNEDSDNTSLKRKHHERGDKPSKKRKINTEDFSDASEENSEAEMSGAESEIDPTERRGTTKSNPDGTWEDIYGRLRAKDGSIVQKSENSKYVPPALRQNLDSEDRKHVEKMNKIRRQLKGLINRLAESNMHSIASQLEEMYMNNSRHDMNDALTNLILESLVSEVIAPERLLIEHVVLITVLHANVGSEVGAHFLQKVAKDFHEYLEAGNDVENKLLDNTVNILAQLYNFKLFDCKLIYEVLEKLSRIFDEKSVECVLHILRSVGFSLRKDDPLALKALILRLQKMAADMRDEQGDNPRVKFMLDILLAIKNNNVKKIPNHDTSYSEHWKKVMKGFIRKSNYVTQLNISLEDLLKADQRGKWWVVGSAWTGKGTNETEDKPQMSGKGEEFSHKLLQIAKQQRMNTDTRRNIFCILMSAEDYMDAFEKILKLGLKNQQEREIINVILHCCLQEKKYNPYYGLIAQKFCDYNRRFQMTIKCSVWDKLKTLEEHSGNQLSNLAKLLTYLFIEQGLAISTLKIVQFSELDNVTLRFIRQILIGVLLHKDEEACLKVFAKVAKAEKLKVFRDSLRLFIHHFLLRNLKSELISESHKEMLQARAKMVELILSSREKKL